MNCESCSLRFTNLNDLVRHVKMSKLHWDPRGDCFLCIPCSRTMFTIPHVIQHVKSEDHSIMALATGIQFDFHSQESRTDLYPPLDFCILCSWRADTPYEQHLESVTHKKIAWIMRAICKKKKINYVNYSSDSSVSTKTKEFMNKMINMKQKEFLGEAHASHHTLKFVCVLCNIYFNKSEYYKEHLSNLSHKRMGQFMIKLSRIVTDLDILGYTSDTEVTETFSNSLSPLYHCEVCRLWIEKSSSYVQHIGGYTHKRIEELLSKLSDKKNGKAISLLLKRQGFAVVNDFNRKKDYCKLCAVWCLNGKQHLVADENHGKIESFVNALTDESDVKFIKVYIDAQARVNFSGCPPNYCKACNVLLSKSEKYNLHLKTVEHKRNEESKEKNGEDEKPSKVLKTSALSPFVEKTQRKSVINYSHFYSARGMHKKNKRSKREISNKVNFHSKSHNSSWLDFEQRSSLSSISSFRRPLRNGETNSPPRELYCELCNFSSTNPLHYDKHLMGDQHKRMRRMLNKKDQNVYLNSEGYATSSNSHPLQFNCELCDVFNYTSREYEEHLKSEKHKRNHWLLYVMIQRPLSV